MLYLRLFVFLLSLNLATSVLAFGPPKIEITERAKEGAIARLTADILQENHFRKPQFDDEVSSRFLDRYLEAWDRSRLLFLESDAQEFERYRTSLDDLTKAGDTEAAQEIFQRYLSRIEQRAEYVTNLLQTEVFKFDTDERYTYKRRDLPRPKDIEEARQLWRQHVRYEYLQEKLSSSNFEFPAAASIGNGAVSLRFSARKLADYKLPEQKLFSAGGREIGALQLDTATSELVISLPEKQAQSNLPEPQKLYSEKGIELGAVSFISDSEATVFLPKKSADEIVRLITTRYNRTLRTVKELSRDEIFEIYLNTLAHVFDPHSSYMSHRQFENFNIQMRLSLVGIGAILESEDGYCKIRELLPGPAADSKKIKPSDRIVAVAQGDGEWVDVVDMKLSKVVDMIRGKAGTEVRLKIIPVDAEDPSVQRVVALTRRKIELKDQEAKAKVIEWPADEGKTLRLGVIDLPSFYFDFEKKTKSTTTDVARLLTKLKQENIDGIILDLRRNGGGSLDEALKLTGLFIKQGPIVQIKDIGGKIVADGDQDPSILYDGPLIVLTSRFSASASEILAGALQDYERALIVGDASTHGKGTVQALVELDRYLPNISEVGALKLTKAQFYRASGSSTQLEGIKPDIVLPSVNNHAADEIGEASLQNPLPHDTVSSAEFEKVNDVAPFLDKLRKRFAMREEKEQDFVYVRQDIEIFQKALAEKSVSLNEEQRRRERKDQKERQAAMKKERLARQAPEQRLFEVTLQNVDQPGLFPPAPKDDDGSAFADNDLPLARAGEAEDEEEDEDKTPPFDFTMEETKRILADYVTLWRERNKSLTLVK